MASMQIPKDEWVPRFAKKLRQLQPAVAGDDAMGLALAEATYPEAADLTPEEGAEIYVLEEPPGEVTSAGDSRRTMTELRTIVAGERQLAGRDRRARRDEDAWKRRFSARLQALKPMLSMLARDHKALAAFNVAHNMAPEDAASIAAKAPPPELRFTAGKARKGVRRPARIEAGIWLLRFVGALLQMKPEVSFDESERAAIETLQAAGVIDPEEAAAIYASKAPPDEVGAPGD